MLIRFNQYLIYELNFPDILELEIPAGYRIKVKFKI